MNGGANLGGRSPRSSRRLSANLTAVDGIDFGVEARRDLWHRRTRRRRQDNDSAPARRSDRSDRRRGHGDSAATSTPTAPRSATASATCRSSSASTSTSRSKRTCASSPTCSALRRRSAEAVRSAAADDAHGAFRKRRAGNLSGGMKQKLALMCTLLHQPQALFLDEPTNGVDPVSRRDFWAILYDLVKDGLTVLVSTSYLDEAERCNRVALMYDGRIIEQGAAGRDRARSMRPATRSAARNRVARRLICSSIPPC